MAAFYCNRVLRRVEHFFDQVTAPLFGRTPEQTGTEAKKILWRSAEVSLQVRRGELPEAEIFGEVVPLRPR